MMTLAKAPKVLVVDDEPDICQNLSDILTDVGYSVSYAYDGLAALEMIRMEPYDIALLDLKMPGMDGISLYREIKKCRPGTVAILVTAYAGGGTTKEAIEAGAWTVLEKPVDLGRLLGLVEKASNQPLVLVVDDDLELCENLWQILRDVGFRVAIAHDLKSATDQILESSFRVVLIDMKLNAGDGSQVFRVIRESNSHARSILVTAHRPEMESLVDQVLAEGADAACYKPFDVKQLLDTLEHLAKFEE